MVTGRKGELWKNITVHFEIIIQNESVYTFVYLMPSISLATCIRECTCMDGTYAAPYHVKLSV